MKKLSKIYQNLNYILISLLIIFAIPKTVFANDNLFIIQGNNFTDSNVIISLLENIPENLDNTMTFLKEVSSLECSVLWR